MREHHPRFLPPAFSDFEVESGGVGQGTIVRFKVIAGGRTREYRMEVAEPEPGRVLTESDMNSSLVTTFTVTPENTASGVQICTTWNGAAGIGGFFERLFAPRVMRGIYADELERLVMVRRPGVADRCPASDLPLPASLPRKSCGTGPLPDRCFEARKADAGGWSDCGWCGGGRRSRHDMASGPSAVADV
jgi:hypothetical protein